MATYNTAFGSLPSTRDLTGQNNATAGGTQQRARRQQPDDEREQAQSQTFADMQKAGQARPAPPPAVGNQAQQVEPDNQPQNNMLGELRDRLSENQPPMDPQRQAQKAYAAANPAATTTPEQDMQSMMAQRQRQQQQAAPSAQGDVQNVYDKYRASQGQTPALTVEQQAAQAQTLRQKQESAGDAGDQTQGDVSARLEALLGQPATAPVETQTAQPDFLSRVSQVVAPPAAATAPAATPAPAPAPAPAAGSAPPAAAPAPTAAPPAAPAAAPAPTPSAPSAPPAPPAAAPAAPMAAPMAPPTAQPSAQPPAMAATGATPQGAAYERFGGSSIGNTMMAQLQQQLQQMQNAPSRFEDPAYKASRDAALANMEAEAGAQRSKLEEELAARGLSASSIGAGRFGDLAGQQARARATLEADLLKEQAQTSAQDRQLLLSSMGDLAKTAGAQDLGAFSANIESMKATGQLDMAAKELMQKAQLEGRSLDLQQARDQVAKELGRADIGFKYASLAQEKGIEEGRLAETKALRLQNLGISNQELELKTAELMGADKTGKLTRQAATDKAELEIKTNQLLQTDRSLSITEAQNLAQNMIDRERITSQETIERNRLTETTRANKAQEEQSKLDLTLRETLGMGTLALDERRTKVSENEFLRDLGKIIADGNLSPEETNAIYARYGYTPPPRTQTPSTPPTTTRVSSPYVGGTDNSL